MKRKYGRKIKVVVFDEKGNKLASWNAPIRLDKKSGTWVRSNGTRTTATELDAVILCELPLKIRQAMSVLALEGR